MHETADPAVIARLLAENRDLKMRLLEAQKNYLLQQRELNVLQMDLVVRELQALDTTARVEAVRPTSMQ